MQVRGVGEVAWPMTRRVVTESVRVPRFVRQKVSLRRALAASLPSCWLGTGLAMVVDMTNAIPGWGNPGMGTQGFFYLHGLVEAIMLEAHYQREHEDNETGAGLTRKAWFTHLY